MTRPWWRAAAAGLLLLTAAGPEPPMKTVKVDGSDPQALQILFGTYGHAPARTVLREADGFRFLLPAGGPPVPQTGAYSYFALGGDCEVTLSYDILSLPTPKGGYGAGLGLAFDAGDEVGRGIIQRAHKGEDGHGYIVQRILAGPKGQPQEEYRFEPTGDKRGRIGLKRVKKELIFLASKTPADPLEEIQRWPFTDRTIRAVRLFADPGGAPTAVDVRLRQIEVRAEEITGGQPRSELGRWRWWWPAAAGVALVAAGAFVVARRNARGQDDETPKPTQRRRGR